MMKIDIIVKMIENYELQIRHSLFFVMARTVISTPVLDY